MGGNIAASAPSQDWPAPNYDDPVTRAWLPIYLWVLHGVTTILVAIRLILRMRREAGGFGLDDAFLLPAWLFGSGFVAFASWSSINGIVDRHAWDVPIDKLWKLPFSAWVGSLLFVIGTGLVKVSVLFFFRRIGAQTFSPRWRYAVWAAITFTFAYSIVLVSLLLFNCSPLEAYWRAYDPFWGEKYHCINTKAINPLAGVFSILSDIYSIALPCIMCRKLNLPWRQKLALNLIFCTGLIVVGAAAGRTWALTMLGKTADVTWQGFWVFFFGALELDLGIICTCLPALRVLLKKQLSDTTQETTEMYGQSAGTYTANCVGPVSSTVAERPTRPNRPSFDEHRVKHPWSRLHEAKGSSDCIHTSSTVSTTGEDDSPIRSPKDFEEISLRALEKSRKSFRTGARGRDGSRA